MSLSPSHLTICHSLARCWCLLTSNLPPLRQQGCSMRCPLLFNLMNCHFLTGLTNHCFLCGPATDHLLTYFLQLAKYHLPPDLYQAQPCLLHTSPYCSHWICPAVAGFPGLIPFYSFTSSSVFFLGTGGHWLAFLWGKLAIAPLSLLLRCTWHGCAFGCFL